MSVVRVFAIVAGGLALAACSGMPSMDFLPSFKSEPPTATARFESEPAGAEARTSTGQACRTPCALPLPAQAFTVTFQLPGYTPQSIAVQVRDPEGRPDGEFQHEPEFNPSPVFAALEPAPPPPAKKHVPPKKPVAKKPPPKKRPAPTAAAPAPAPAPATTASPAAPPPGQLSPWPAAPPPR